MRAYASVGVCRRLGTCNDSGRRTNKQTGRGAKQRTSGSTATQTIIAMKAMAVKDRIAAINNDNTRANTTADAPRPGGTPAYAGWVKRPTTFSFVSRWCAAYSDPPRLIFSLSDNAGENWGSVLKPETPRLMSAELGVDPTTTGESAPVRPPSIRMADSRLVEPEPILKSIDTTAPPAEVASLTDDEEDESTADTTSKARAAAPSMAQPTSPVAQKKGGGLLKRISNVVSKAFGGGHKEAPAPSTAAPVDPLLSVGRTLGAEMLEVAIKAAFAAETKCDKVAYKMGHRRNTQDLTEESIGTLNKVATPKGQQSTRMMYRQSLHRVVGGSGGGGRTWRDDYELAVIEGHKLLGRELRENTMTAQSLYEFNFKKGYHQEKTSAGFSDEEAQVVGAVMSAPIEAAIAQALKEDSPRYASLVREAVMSLASKATKDGMHVRAQRQ